LRLTVIWKSKFVSLLLFRLHRSASMNLLYFVYIPDMETMSVTRYQIVSMHETKNAI